MKGIHRISDLMLSPWEKFTTELVTDELVATYAPGNRKTYLEAAVDAILEGDDALALNIIKVGIENAGNTDLVLDLWGKLEVSNGA